MFKRLLTVAGGAGILAIALAATALAGGGLGGPGRFTFNDLSANANFTDSSGNFIGFVNVDRGVQSFHLKRGPVIEQNGTVLSVGTPSGFGCWVIPDSAFVIASDLSSASLQVTADASMVCPGILVSGAAGGRPGLQSVIGFGGGGGGGGPLTSISVNLRWTGSGGLWENHNSGTSHCGSYNAANQGTFDYEFAPATGTVDLVGTVIDPFAQVAHSSFSNVANGFATGACNPFGF